MCFFLNDNNFKSQPFYLFLNLYVFFYNKFKKTLTRHVHFTPFMCGKGLLKF